MDFILPLGMAFAGLIALVIYILCMALKTTTKQIDLLSGRLASQNEQLLLMIAHQDGGADAARSLLASQKKPPQKEKQPVSGKSPDKGLSEKKKTGVTFRIGAK